MHVDTTWMTLFSQMSCNIENIPPTQAASDQHIKRASYQSGHLWGQSLNFQTILIGDGRHPKLPGKIPKLTTLAIAEVAFLALISCKCAKSCMGNCNCFKADLECAPLCKCGGTCYNWATGTMIRGHVSWYAQSSSSSFPLAFPVICGRRYGCRSSLSSKPCLLQRPLSVLQSACPSCTHPSTLSLVSLSSFSPVSLSSSLSSLRDRLPSS